MNRTYTKAVGGYGGFALIEMLSSLVILTLSITVGARLFGLILRNYHDAPAAIAAIRTQQQWLAMMRDDAWRATSFDARDESQLSLLVDAKTISWRQEADQIVRESADDSRRWPIASPTKWTTDHDVLTLTQGESRVPLASPCLGGQTP